MKEAAEKGALGQGGVMRQAFCGVLQQELRDYYRLMAILEAQSQQAPPCAAGGARSQPTCMQEASRVCQYSRPCTLEVMNIYHK